MRLSWLLLPLVLLQPLLAGAQQDGQRGQMLYATHCAACHDSAIHWRQQRLVTDLTSLELQVRRWQKNAGLNWGDEDVRRVVRYLNDNFYHFSGKDALGRLDPGVAH